MIFILGIVLIFSLGLAFTLWVAPSLARLERLALAWVIGLGFATQVLFLLSILSVRYSVLSLLLSLFLVNLFFWSFARKKMKLNKKIRFSFTGLVSYLRYWFMEFSLVDQILIILLAILVFGVFVRALYWPVYYWDALAWYDYRGRIFFEAGGIASATVLASIPIHGFPPMTSLSHTLVYLLAGEKANPQFLYPLYYLALLVIFYVSVRKHCYRWVSLVFTFVLASIPFFIEFASNAYTNLPYAFYFGVGIIYLFRFMQEKEQGLVVISGILLGLSAWTRSPTEQFFIATVAIFVVWCWKQRKYYFSPFLLVILFLAFFIPWKIYIFYTLNIPLVASEIGQAVGSGFTSPLNLRLFWEVVKLLFVSIKGVSGTSLALAFLVTIFFPRSAKKNIYLLMILVSNFTLLVLGSYAFGLSWHNWRDSVLNSVNRLSMFLPPFVLYYTAISIPTFLKKEEKRE